MWFMYLFLCMYYGIHFDMIQIWMVAQIDVKLHVNYMKMSRIYTSIAFKCI